MGFACGHGAASPTLEPAHLGSHMESRGPSGFSIPYASCYCHTSCGPPLSPQRTSCSLLITTLVEREAGQWWRQDIRGVPQDTHVSGARAAEWVHHFRHISNESTSPPLRQTLSMALSARGVTPTERHQKTKEDQAEAGAKTSVGTEAGSPAAKPEDLDGTWETANANILDDEAPMPYPPHPLGRPVWSARSRQSRT